MYSFELHMWNFPFSQVRHPEHGYWNVRISSLLFRFLKQIEYSGV
jgi:hypothetical protein